MTFMDTILSIIEELITALGNTNLAADLATAGQLATHILALLGNKNAQRDLQSEDAYKAAQLGSVTAAQWLYHNSQPDSGMPHEDIVRGQFYWNELYVAGWSVINGTVVPPAPPVQ